MTFPWTRAILGAAVAAGVAGPAIAADFYEPPIVEAPPPVKTKSYGGWYIRGHIGMSNQRFDGLYNVLFDTTDNLEFLDEGGFDSAPIYSVGVGYRLNDWLRGDLTAEYRGKAHFSALDRYEVVDDGDPTTWDGTNEYSAKKSEWLLLANAYVDLGKWHGISPYLGAGIGMSRNTISHFRDINMPTLGVAYADADSKWNLAWALHAGMSFDVTDNLALDLGYSFTHLGDARSGDLVTYTGVNAIDNPMHFNDIYSHDVKLGLRYQFGGAKHVAYDPVPQYEPEPLIYK
ncbi:MAG: porin family protein [Rhizobiaceae bacterium]|nr:porin family protein [Rhizobiaceae bacterium]MCV0404650.1 porin family protein [Rhizobiaceae bacterium]